jgi:hypothetical protein
MLAREHTLSEVALPRLDPRQLARRIAVAALLAGVDVVAGSSLVGGSAA